MSFNFITKHIPNTLTSLNLACGCLGIVSVLEGSSIPAAYFVWAACVFDFLDGFAARLLSVNSAIGKELDSLADVVSFGVLPSVLVYTWLSATTTQPYLPYVAFLLAIFSALRLAKFNVDTRQSDSFIGVPTPANALFITALPFLPSMLRDELFSPLPLFLLCLCCSYWLVAEWPLLALKFKHAKWKGNESRFLLLSVAFVLLVLLQQAALPLVILVYVGLSLIGRALKWH